MSPSEPLISVVITTINRPQPVIGAAPSALRQSLREIEVIVVVDGPDAETLQALRLIDDPRLRIVPLRENVGVGAARHAGVDAARGRWVALLDDDDEWLRLKLEIQLATAPRSLHRWPIITCRVIARSQHGDAVRPQRCLTQGEVLCRSPGGSAEYPCLSREQATSTSTRAARRVAAAATCCACRANRRARRTPPRRRRRSARVWNPIRMVCRRRDWRARSRLP